MKKMFALLLTLFLCTAAFAQKNVAVLEIDRRGSVEGEISRDEAMEITGVIRSVAVRVLPRRQFSVMTSETVQAMGGAVMSECFDETCVIQIGRTIDAEYVVRGVLNKFRTMFTLNVEMFETEYGNLVATSSAIRSENLVDLLSASESVCEEMFRTFLESSATQHTAPAPAAQPVAPSAPPTLYTLTVRQNPEHGGIVTVSPFQAEYDAGTSITAIAAPADGFHFAGWTGASRSRNERITFTIDNNATLTARFREDKPEPTPRAPRPTPEGNFVERHRLQIQISTGALAGVGIIGGMIYNSRANDEFDKFMSAEIDSDAERTARNNTESNVSTRNLLYTLGILGAAGLSLTFFF